MVKYGLVGEKLGHSFSVELHRKLGNSEYELLEIPRDKIDDFFAAAEFAALNVTIPYKEVAFKYCIPDDAASKIGAINTLVKNGDVVRGYNTDYLGCMYMLKRAGIDLKSRKVAILGSGGTSKTARYVCELMEANECVVVSRSGDVTYADTDKYADAEVLINTTPVGMYPECDCTPVSLELFTNLKAVADVIYNPYETKLVKEARERGITATNGLSMLVAQGFYAEELFMDKKMDESVIERIVEDMMR